MSNSENQLDAASEVEISLLDVIHFLQSAWKKLVLASLIGAVIGLSGWIVLGNYSAEYVLLNNYNNNNNQK